jgi:hypothetical protein
MYLSKVAKDLSSLLLKYKLEPSIIPVAKMLIDLAIKRIDELIGRLLRLLPQSQPAAQRRRRRQLSEAEVLARRAKIRARQKRHREHQGRFYAKRWWVEQ